MNTRNKRILIIAGIIFITVINLAALSTQLYQAYFQPKTELRKERSGRTPEHDHKRFHRQFVERMGFSDEQEQVFWELSRETYRRSRPLMDQLNLKRRHLLEQLSQEAVDTSMVSILTEEIGQLHAQLKKVSADHYLSLKNICTPEQQTLLLEFYDRMIPQGPDRKGKGRNRRHQNRREGDDRNVPRRMQQKSYFEY